MELLIGKLCLSQCLLPDPRHQQIDIYLLLRQLFDYVFAVYFSAKVKHGVRPVSVCVRLVLIWYSEKKHLIRVWLDPELVLCYHLSERRF